MTLPKEIEKCRHELVDHLITGEIVCCYCNRDVRCLIPSQSKDENKISHLK